MDRPQRVLLRKPRLPTKRILPKIPSTTGEMTLDMQSGIDDGTSFTLTDSRQEPDFSTPGISDTKFTESYREYTFEGASPPPPSELSAMQRHDAFSMSLISHDNVSRAQVYPKKTYEMPERQYMLDPTQRQPTNLGTYVEGKSLLRPQKRRGPAPLPARAPLQAYPKPPYVDITDEWEQYYVKSPEFTLNDFLVHIAEIETFDYNFMSKLFFSRHNYKRIQQMLFETYIRPKNDRVHHVTIEPPNDLQGYPQTRVPQKQLILEMVSMIKEQMSEVMNVPMIPVVRALPKYHPSYRPDEPRPHTEIVLYELGDKRERKQVIQRYHPAEKPNLNISFEEDEVNSKENEENFYPVPLRQSQTDPHAGSAGKQKSLISRETSKSAGQVKCIEGNASQMFNEASDKKEKSKLSFKEQQRQRAEMDNLIDTMEGAEFPYEQHLFLKETTGASSFKPGSKKNTKSAGSGGTQVLHRGSTAATSASQHILQTGTPQYFQDSRRSNSPFHSSNTDTISPAELAVLDSIMAGGKALSLKAHFLKALPTIGALSETLTYLNLSFNNFTKVPPEVLEITNLETLKLRDNPLQRLPEGIAKLDKLTTLVLSFCLLSHLPADLFLLPNLRHLDLAYNKLQHIPNKLGDLAQLEELNVEGNQIKGLPANAMKLKHLKRLRVRNNFMHPCFWTESIINSPPRLGDLAATTVARSNVADHFHKVPDHMVSKLQGQEMCQCCMRPFFGNGLTFLRPVTKLFGIKQLPILFNCCTPTCLADSREDDTLVSMFM